MSTLWLKRKSVDMDKVRQEIIENERKKQLIRTQDLLEIIERTPGIWNKNSSKYRLTNRNELWLQICEEMIPDFKNMTVTAQKEIAQRLIKKWHNTRDSYRKALRAKRAYTYAPFLTFLDPFIADATIERYDDDENVVKREDIKIFKIETTCEENEDEKEDENTESNNEDSGDIKSACKSEEICVEVDNIDVTPAKILRTDLSDEDNDWSTQNTSYFAQNENVLPVITKMLERETDEDRAFFNSLIPAVKRLSEETKMEFKIQVLTTLKKLTAKQRDPIEFD